MDQAIKVIEPYTKSLSFGVVKEIVKMTRKNIAKVIRISGVILIIIGRIFGPKPSH